MHIIIVGAGVTGIELARRLIIKKHTVVLIEKNEETARHAANRLDCAVTQASGNDPQVLKDAHIHKADALIAVTDSDELNMIICGVVESIAPQVLKIARVRNENYVMSLNTVQERMLGIDFLVHPDQEAAQAIMNAVEYGAVSDIVAFENSPYQLICFTIEKDSRFDGLALRDIRSVIHQDISFVIVSVEEQGMASIPSGQTILHTGMRISILCLPADIEQFYMLAGCEIKPIKKIALVGIGKIGSRVASALTHQKPFKLFAKLFGKSLKHYKELTIIDKNDTLTKYAAENYPDAQVYRGDVTDESFIEEIDLKSFDLVITATQNYELNMITATYFKTLGIRKTITLVQSATMSNIAYKIGIDVAIPFKDVTVDTIMSHLGGRNLTRIHTMGGGSLEIVEITIGDESELAGKALKEIAPHGIFLILLITHEAVCRIPDGNTILAVNDKLVVITQVSYSDQVIKEFAGEE